MDSKHRQRIVAFVFGAIFLVVLLAIAIYIPHPSDFQILVFRIVLALAAAGVAAMIPGFINVSVADWIRAGGAIAVFVIIFTVNPPTLVATAVPSNAGATQEYSPSSAVGTHDTYEFRILAVDDTIVCELNGSEIARVGFGRPDLRWDVSNKVKKGMNRLRCRVIDEDLGTSYSWHYELLKNGQELIIQERYTCTKDNSACASATSDVHDKTHTFAG